MQAGNNIDGKTDDGPAASFGGIGVDLGSKPSLSAIHVREGAAFDVLAERMRQVSGEGYGAGHDDEHTCGELHIAARCYLYACLDREHGTSDGTIGRDAPDDWPWSEHFWKPRSQRRDLVRAAALIIAEIERIDRAVARGDLDLIVEGAI